MKQSGGICTLAALLVVAVVMIAEPTYAADEIVREGVGQRRQALDKMELTDFDQSLWSGLADWINGDPITPESIDGKVVLVYTWSGFLPTAVRPISVVNRLVDRYGDKGLVVVGIHNDEGWEEAAKTAERRRAAFPIARDAGNAFRAAMHVDQDPDFYLIDRSGRIRYADIETASVERAVALLVGESVSDARSLLDRMAMEEAVAAENARRTARIRGQINLSELPWPNFVLPSAEAYKSAKWPRMKAGDERRRSRRGAPAGPVSINWNSELMWHPHMPEHTSGRVVLVYLFNPKFISDSAADGRTVVDWFQWLDQIQVAHSRDLLVVGAMIRSEAERRSRRNDDDAMKPEEIAENFRKMMEIPVNHFRVSDYNGSLVSSRLSPNNGEDGRGRGRGRGAFLLPYHILISSDGVVRWHGNVNSSTERFAEWEAALDTMLKVDPGVAARRAAEEAYIKTLSE